MATRGRIKGWKSPATVAAMSPEEREAYEAMIAKAKAEREAEKNADLIAKGIDPETHKKEKAEKAIQKEEKKVNLQNLINTQLEYQSTHIMSQEEDEDSNGKPWYQENDDGNDHKETNINHLAGEGFCIIETNEDFWIRKISEMIEKTPDKVIVLDNWSQGDLLRVKVPYSAMKKIKTQTRTISEEQRQRMSELGKTMGKKRGRPRKNPVKVKENENDVLESNGNDIVRNDDAGIPQPTSSGLDFTEVSKETDMALKAILEEEPENKFQEEPENKSQEESDEEFEGTPMNKYRDYTTEESLDEDDDIAYAIMPSMSFGVDVKKIREHETPKAIHCDTADNEDYELYEDDDDYDKYE